MTPGFSLFARAPRPLALCCAGAALLAILPARADTVIVNVRIVDGTGAPARTGGVRIAKGRIMAVNASVRARPRDTVIDGRGQVLAPGFIDSHSHLDRTMFERRGVPAAVSQGVTTIIVGQDGMSPEPVAALARRLRRTPVAVNVGSYSGHNDLRRRIMGDTRTPATPAQVAAMAALLDADMKAGAIGLSTGLLYEPGTFSDTAEVIALARVAARRGGRYISHVRNESDMLDTAIDELIAVGRATGMPVQLSHIKIGIRRDWGRAPQILARLERARAEGVDVTADVYPYTYWQTTMRALFPDKRFDDPAGVAFNFRETNPPDKLTLTLYRPDPRLELKTIAEIAAARGQDPVRTYLDLMAAAIAYETTHPGTGRAEAIVGHGMAESDVATFLAWPHANIGSDGTDGGHPRGYGTFTRVLGHYVRETKLLTLEQAIFKMTGLAAQHLGLGDRGVLRPGARADLVLFDPALVADRASIGKDRALSAGIVTTWVNGVPVFDRGAPTGAHPGRFVTARPARIRQ